MSEEVIPQSGAVILVVEDERPIRQIMERALARHGYRVIAAASADEALYEARRCPEIHLLITDIVMRGMNGHELATVMRRSRPELQVLYVSGFSQKQTGLADTAPDTAYLQKPFGLDELVQRVGRLLAG
jgi:two-component system cell cycle sensor histidine kinase/response regulator CckA